MFIAARRQPLGSAERLVIYILDYNILDFEQFKSNFLASSSFSSLSSLTTSFVRGVIVRIRFMIISRIIINITNYNPVFLY